MAAAQIFLGRQPILNQRHELIGYELLFRHSPLPNKAIVANGMQATATVITHAFYELSLGNALGAYKGFINVDAEFLLSDAVELLPANQVVLEILETVAVTPELVARCQDLRRRGYTFALDDFFELNDAIAPLLEVADIIKICMKTVPAERLPQLTQELKPYRRRLLAEKVETGEQLNYCTGLGFELFQGYYFAKPTVLAGKKIHHSRLALLRLLTQMQREADTVELEKTFKHEPGLSVNLLRLTNSAAAGLRTKITSLRHAITLLGRSQLQRWVQLLLYTDFDGNNATPLLQMAATRARLMELLAGYYQPGDRDYADRAFMTGIMSLTPTLLGLPIQEILNQLAILPQDIQQALLVRSGTLGALLSIGELLDGEESPEQLPPLLEQLPGITLASITDSLAKALDWANNLEKEPM